VEGTAVLGRLTWLAATVAGLVDETPRVRTLAIDVAGWRGHRPGQHVDVRLTAEDGYQAARSYSIGSAPAAGRFEVTVERLDDGEVSPYLAGDLGEGDQFEVRGPLGGYFVWDSADGGPLLLIGGGSGVVPLMSMIRRRAAEGADVPVRLLLSSRAWDDAIYRDELAELEGDGLEVAHTLTRSQPPGWTGYARRIDVEMLRDVAWPVHDAALAYVCGPTAFVEVAASGLVEHGYANDRIRTERFGPTGG